MNSKRRNTQLVNENGFEAYLRARLEEESEPLSPQLLRQLRMGRTAALAQAQNRPSWPTWKPFASFATAAVLVLTLGYFNLQGGPVAREDDFNAEAELLFAEEDLQLYEDLEFYRWLATNDF